MQTVMLDSSYASEEPAVLSRLEDFDCFHLWFKIPAKLWVEKIIKIKDARPQGYRASVLPDPDL